MSFYSWQFLCVKKALSQDFTIQIGKCHEKRSIFWTLHSSFWKFQLFPSVFSLQRFWSRIYNTFVSKLLADTVRDYLSKYFSSLCKYFSRCKSLWTDTCGIPVCMRFLSWVLLLQAKVPMVLWQGYDGARKRN